MPKAMIAEIRRLRDENERLRGRQKCAEVGAAGIHRMAEGLGYQCDALREKLERSEERVRELERKQEPTVADMDKAAGELLEHALDKARSDARADERRKVAREIQAEMTEAEKSVGCNLTLLLLRMGAWAERFVRENGGGE